MIQRYTLLNKEEQENINRILKNAHWESGKNTASGSAISIKENKQIQRNSFQKQQLDQLILNAIQRNSAFFEQFFIKSVMPPHYAKYEAGDGYGWHVDSPVMTYEIPVRTDLAMTVFLSSSGDYQGGELELEDGEKLKLDCGDAVVYPASVLHRVRRIDNGCRIVAVTWIESFIKDNNTREDLFQLKTIAEKIAGDYEDESNKLLQVFSNNFKKNS